MLEQEKHVLRRKLDAVQGEYDSKVSELQGDVSELRKVLEDQQNSLKAGERHKSGIITQLTEQNHRLTAQLKEVRNRHGEHRDRQIKREEKTHHSIAVELEMFFLRFYL